MLTPKLISTYPTAIHEFIGLARRVKNSLTGNPNFPEPWVGCSLEELSTSLDILQQATDDAQNHDSLKVKHRDKAKADTSGIMRKIAKNVELMADGNLAMLQTSGFEVQKERRLGPVGHLPPPDAYLKHGERRGMFYLKGKAVPGAGSYQVQITDKDPSIEENWGTYGTVMHCSSVEINGRTSGQNYWVRIRSIGAAGAGEWSTPITIMSL